MAEFDAIADVYDSTRRAASEAEIAAIRKELVHCNTILDVGVGTGRFAKPLLETGFDVYGVDVSKGMMAKAREKCLMNLVLADAAGLPFRSRTFDAAIMIHVLHLLPDWRSTVREVGRVTKKAVISLWRERPGQQGQYGTNSPFGSMFWEEYARLRAEMGYAVDERRLGMWYNQKELKNAVPPKKLEKVTEEVDVLTVGELIRRFQDRWSSRAFRFSRDVPEEVHRRIMERLLSAIPLDMNKTIERRRVEEMAVWSPEQLHFVQN